MTALATIPDVEAILGRFLTDEEAFFASRLLDMASTVVRTHTGQTISLVTNETVTLRIPTNRGPQLRRLPHVILPQRPIVGVTAVSIGARALAAGGWYVDDATLFLGYGDYWPSINAGPIYSLRDGEVTVTYTHGYDPVPDDVVLVVAGLVAARVRAACANPDGVDSETVGTYSIRYERGASAASLVLSDADRAALAPYGRQVGTIYTASSW